MSNFSRQLCLKLYLTCTRIWETSSVGNAQSRNYVVTHLWSLIQRFIVMEMDMLFDQLRYIPLHAYDKHNALRDTGSKIYLSLPQSEHNALFLCWTLKVPQMWVTVYRIALTRNLWKDMLCLIVQIHNETNYSDLVYDAFRSIQICRHIVSYFLALLSIVHLHQSF